MIATFVAPSASQRVQKMKFHKYVIVFVTLIAAFSEKATMAKPEAPPSDVVNQGAADKDQAPSGLPTASPRYAPYCGLYSLHIAMGAEGVKIPFRDLLKPENVSTRAGSSIEDLDRIAKQYGLYTNPVSRMTCAMLREAGSPVILHVRPKLGAVDYSHWIVFMGTEDGKAIIYDDWKEELIAFGNLALRWDGVGLIISKAPISTSHLKIVALAAYVSYVGIASIVVALTYLLQRMAARVFRGQPVAPWLSALGQSAALVVLAACCGFAFRYTNPSGYLDDPVMVAGVQNHHWAGFLPVINAHEADELLGNQDATFVDARSLDDFNAGHIDGAISVPSNVSPADLLQKLSAVPKSERFVVYCQFDGCSYGNEVAKRLDDEGFHNLILFKGGWQEWLKYTPNNANAPTGPNAPQTESKPRD